MAHFGRNRWHKKIRYKHAGLFSGNTSSVLWTKKGGRKKSSAKGRLIRVLALRQRLAKSSPLLDVHVAADMNMIGDISSCSFGCSKQWYCTNDSEFLSLINS